MPASIPLTVPLDPDLHRLVQEKVASGRYGSAADVVREALLRLDGGESSGSREVAGSLEEARTALKESEERIRTLADHLPDGLVYQVQAGPDGARRFLFVSAGAERLFGVSPADAQRDASLLYDLIPEPYRSTVAEREEEALAARSPYRVEVPSRRADGSLGWIQIASAPRSLRDGSVVWDGVVLDVTERRRAEEGLRASEERLRRLADNIPNGMVYQAHRTPDGVMRFTYVSRGIERLHGVSPEEALADFSLLDRRIPEEHRPRVEAARRAAGETMRDIDLEIPMRMPSGEVRWFQRTSAGRALPDGGQLWEGVEIDVTGRKRAEAELEARRRELETVLATVPAGVWFTSDPEAREVQSNAFAAGLLQLGEAGPADLPLRRALRGEAVRDDEYAVVQPDGSVRTLLANAAAIRDEAGAVIGAVTVGLDITDRKAAEDRERFLSDLNERLRALSDPTAVMGAAAEAIGLYLGAARAGYAEVAEDGRAIVIEREWLREGAPSVRGRFLIDDFGTRFADRLRAGRTVAIRDVLGEEGLTDRERKACARVGLRARLTVPITRSGRLDALLFIHHSEPRAWGTGDVAVLEQIAERVWLAVERARSETALREREERLRLALEAGRLGSWDLDLVAGTRLLSPRSGEIFGVDPSLLHDRPAWREVVHPDDRDRVDAAFQAALRGEADYRIEFRVLARDGQVRWAASQALVQRGPDGTPRRVTGIHQDVTEQRRAEAALRESEARFRALAETTPQLVWSADRHGVVDYVSPQCVAYTGIPAQRALAGGWREAVHPADRRRVAEAWRAAVRGGELFDIEYRVRRHDGEFRWFKARGAPMRDALGAVERWFGVATDIHDVVRAGEALRRSERRQRLMVHELNHRVKNTLATVQSLAAQSLRGAKGDEQAREVFEARLFALSRTHDVLTRENWDGAELRDIAAEAVAPYARDEAHRFLVEGPELRLAPATALALAMALHELATNAVKYGALSNETGRVIVIWGLGGPADARRLRLRWAETGGPPVHPPERRGFGSRLVERGLARELGGEVRLEFHESGVICDIDAPLTAAPELLQAAE